MLLCKLINESRNEEVDVVKSSSLYWRGKLLQAAGSDAL